MVISPRARRYLVAAIYISLSTAPLLPSYFAYNELRRYTPFRIRFWIVYALRCRWNSIEFARFDRGKIFDNSLLWKLKKKKTFRFEIKKFDGNDLGENRVSFGNGGGGGWWMVDRFLAFLQVAGRR